MTGNFISSHRFVLPALLAALLVFFNGCKKRDPEPTPEPAKTFDKQALLVNLADHVIIPAYTDFNRSIVEFSTEFDSMIESGDPADFYHARKKFDAAYSAYQRISILGFGPGEEEAIRVSCNIFPCDSHKVMNNVRSGSYDLSTAANIAAKGFPALDFLLWDSSSVVLPHAFFSDTKRTAYVKSLLTDIRQRTSSALMKWQGGYRNTFVNSLGTDVGSSIGFVINQLNFELDYLKNSKIATPLGLRSGGTAVPNNSEAFYSGHSVKYALLTLDAIEALYAGISSSGNNGLGFDDYAVHLNIQRGSEPLSAVIATQFGVARQKLQALPDPLSEQVISNKENVQVAYNELVKLLVLLKTDLPSGLGVVITYQDGDGD